MSNHTPGPWNVNGKQSIRGANSEYIARTNWQNGEANARLIAAAPELLEALMLADQHLRTLYPTGVEQGDYICSAVRSAINKAKGAA
jgi:hypothetical protein